MRGNPFGRAGVAPRRIAELEAPYAAHALEMGDRRAVVVEHVRAHVADEHVGRGRVDEAGQLQVAHLAVGVGVGGAHESGAHHVTEDAGLNLGPLKASPSALVDRKTPTLGSRAANEREASSEVAKCRPPGLRAPSMKKELQLSRITCARENGMARSQAVRSAARKRASESSMKPSPSATSPCPAKMKSTSTSWPAARAARTCSARRRPTALRFGSTGSWCAGVRWETLVRYRGRRSKAATRAPAPWSKFVVARGVVVGHLLIAPSSGCCQSRPQSSRAGERGRPGRGLVAPPATARK